MNRFHTYTAWSLLGVANLIGCGAADGTSGEVTAAASNPLSVPQEASAAEVTGGDPVPMADRPPRPRRHGHRGHHGGPDFLLGAALHEPINLTADQRTRIETALSEARPEPPPKDDSHRASLAAAVRAGKIDVIALSESKGSAAHRDQRRAASAKALSTLHSILTKEQRALLVDAIVERKSGPPPGPPSDHGPMHHRGRGRLFEGLDLTAAQEQAIEAQLERQRPRDAERQAMKTEHESMRATMQARLRTFVNDDFDAVAFVTPPEKMEKPRGGPHGHLVEDLAIIVPLLSQEQRETLATRMEQGPPMHGPKDRR